MAMLTFQSQPEHSYVCHCARSLPNRIAYLSRLQHTAEDKEAEIRRLQAELQRILRKRKEAARSVATQTADERAVGAAKLRSGVSSVASAETVRPGTGTKIAGTARPARDVRSTESRRATESAVVIDDGETPVGFLTNDGETPVVLPTISPVELSGSVRNGKAQPSGTGGATRPRSERVSESPSFLDLGEPALDSVRVNLFPSDRAEQKNRNRRAESKPERLDGHPTGRRRSEGKGTAEEKSAEKPRSYLTTRDLSDAPEKNLDRITTERNGIFDRGGLGEFESETPQMPRALLDRAATLERAARGKASPKSRFENLHPEKDRDERPELNRAESGRKVSAARAERDWPERTPADSHRNGRQRNPSGTSAERTAAELQRNGSRHEARGAAIIRNLGESVLVYPEERCKPHALCLTPTDCGSNLPGLTPRFEKDRRSSAVRSPVESRWEPRLRRVGNSHDRQTEDGEGEKESEEDRFYTPYAGDFSPLRNDDSETSSVGGETGGKGEDGFFTPYDGRGSWGWDPARDPLPSSKEGLLELRDALQLRVQVGENLRCLPCSFWMHFARCYILWLRHFLLAAGGRPNQQPFSSMHT